MATIEIVKHHSLDRATARTKAEELAQRLKEKLSLELEWRGDSVMFESTSGAAKGAKGSIELRDGEVVVNVDLPLMLRPLKGMVESKIREKLDAF
jgi:putative polyhydroxyalkanoate system protein